MDYMPFFFDLKNRSVLLIGGGAIATRKARLIVKAGAKLTVVSPYITDELQQLVASSGGDTYVRKYKTTDLEHCMMVICATDDSVVNRQVSQEAQDKNLPVNVVDSPDLCSIITPAIVDRSPLMIAITSGGDAPVLARQMRAKLEVLFPSSYGALAKLASGFRDRVKNSIRSGETRLRFWQNVFNGSVAEKAFAGHIDEAKNELDNYLTRIEKGEEQDSALTKGEVYLVGGGPGDPDLLTFKALRLMQQADVVKKVSVYYALKAATHLFLAVVVKRLSYLPSTISIFKWCRGLLLPLDALRTQVFP